MVQNEQKFRFLAVGVHNARMKLAKEKHIVFSGRLWHTDSTQKISQAYLS